MPDATGGRLARSWRSRFRMSSDVHTSGHLSSIWRGSARLGRRCPTTQFKHRLRRGQLAVRAYTGDKLGLHSPLVTYATRLCWISRCCQLSESRLGNSISHFLDKRLLDRDHLPLEISQFGSSLLDRVS